ncbi:hypothetical protein CH063_02299, partial [Colletotrichum higginsianum]
SSIPSSLYISVPGLPNICRISRSLSRQVEVYHATTDSEPDAAFDIYRLGRTASDKRAAMLPAIVLSCCALTIACGLSGSHISSDTPG